MRMILHFNRKNQSGKAPVQFEIYLNRSERMYFSPGVVIESKYWDAKANQVKGIHPESQLMNLKIESLRTKLLSLVKKYVESGITPSKAMFKRDFEGKKEFTETLNEYIEKQLKHDMPGLAYSTYKQHNGVLKNLNKWKTVLFTDIDSDFLKQYHNHLLATMKQSSTSKNHKVLRKYLRRAFAAKMIDENPYNNFKIPACARRMIFLTEEEINKIREKEFSTARMNVVKDIFLFLCNTGMEYSDVMALKHEDIVINEGNHFIIKPREKVSTEMQAIPLMNEALEIIQKYSDKGKQGLIFPRRSNQRLNTYLKEIADVCGIDKPITTIVARHTFATLMLTRGLPLETVSHILGHSNTKTTRNYAKLVTSKITNDLKRMNIEKI